MIEWNKQNHYRKRRGISISRSLTLNGSNQITYCANESIRKQLRKLKKTDHYPLVRAQNFANLAAQWLLFKRCWPIAESHSGVVCFFLHFQSGLVVENWRGAELTIWVHAARCNYVICWLRRNIVFARQNYWYLFCCHKKCELSPKSCFQCTALFITSRWMMI